MCKIYGYQLVFRQISILKSEVALLPLTPRALPIEVYVYPLLVFLCDSLWLRVPLEPCQVFDVESPRLSLQLFCCKISVRLNVNGWMFASHHHSLLISPRKEIKHIEKSLHIQLRENPCSAQHRIGCLRVVLWCLEWIPWYVILRPVGRSWCQYDLANKQWGKSVLLCVMGLRYTVIPTLEQFLYLVEVRHTMRC